MNEEAMTPDKEQVVEPLSARTPDVLSHEEIERRIAAADNEVSALCKGPHRPGGRSWRMSVPVDPTDSDIVFVNVIDATRQLLDAARTASVAGLDRERLAAAISDAYDNPEYEEGWFDKGDIPRPAVMSEQIAASYDRLGSAPSIEQEPGETEKPIAGHNHTPDGLPTFPVFREACPLGCDAIRAGEMAAISASGRPNLAVVDPFVEVAAMQALGDTSRLEAAVNRYADAIHLQRPFPDAALREQEPGETLRAALTKIEAWTRDAKGISRPTLRDLLALIHDTARAALEADPQETER